MSRLTEPALFDANGLAIYRTDGKVLKSDRYSPPDVASCLVSESPDDGGTRC